MTDKSNIILPHGGYKNLMSYQNAVIVHDLTVMFCDKYIDRFSRTKDQMIQAARSGKQNIVEGSMAAGISRETEIKLVGVARASQEELLADYHDFLRQHQLLLWGKDDERVIKARKLTYMSNRTYITYESYMADSESAANVMVCLIHQTNYLLDQLLRALERDFIKGGGLRERLYNARKNYRGY
ncbi:four helix bundle protein [Candidatus Falkowbacteria bacterium]|nr:four helix bundle protein [Candidatus Falkowbacteria bacterium]